jgi:hypothetical protein
MGSRRVLIEDRTSPGFPPEGFVLNFEFLRGNICCWDPSESAPPFEDIAIRRFFMIGQNRGGNKKE